MPAYYNENEPYAAQWLRNLIAAGHLAPGDVDDRSIADVQASDLKGYTQCHFFAGIGGWSYALRLARWPDDKEVWTGSCPCQPFSVAGKGGSFADERHLWPHWFRLIHERRPATIFGEQVANAIKRGWLDVVFADLEGEGYACGAAILPACGVGASHIRQRLWFVGHSRSGQHWQDTGAIPKASECGVGFASAGANGELADADQPRPQTRNGFEAARGAGTAAVAGSHNGFWSDLVWLPCTDGKARPTKSGIFPLAHGIPARMGKLRATGNAIVPQVAAEFIRCFAGS